MQIERHDKGVLSSAESDEQNPSDSTPQSDDDHFQESETSTKDGGNEAETK